MISAIVLATGDSDAPEHVCELAVRSLAWLVSAVVDGVVRDVVAACPTTWPVVDIMDQAGCALVQAEDERERLAAAAARAKCPRVLVVRAGFQPEGPLAAEIDATERRPRASDATLLLEAPARFGERLLPNLAPVAGMLLWRSSVLSPAPTFRALARQARGSVRFRTRVVPVL